MCRNVVLDLFRPLESTGHFTPYHHAKLRFVQTELRLSSLFQFGAHLCVNRAKSGFCLRLSHELRRFFRQPSRVKRLLMDAPVVVGDVLLDKYRVERVLGQGGMGFVVAVRHIDLGQLYAMKFLLPAGLGHPEAMERFLREAQAAALLRSDHATVRWWSKYWTSASRNIRRRTRSN